MANPFPGSVSLEVYLNSVTLDPCLEFLSSSLWCPKKTKTKQRILIKLCEFVGETRALINKAASA